MSHAKRVTRDNGKNPEYRVVAAIRKLRADTNCPAGKSWPNHVKNEQHIGSEKTYGPKNTEQLSIRKFGPATEEKKKRGNLAPKQPEHIATHTTTLSPFF